MNGEEMKTIKLAARFESSKRGRPFYTGLSCGAFLVTLGHEPIEVISRNGKITAVFKPSAQIFDDAVRYRRSTETLIAQASANPRP